MKRGQVLKIEHRVQLLEEELKIMKNEIKSILLDLREQCTQLDSETSTTNKIDVKQTG